MWTLYDIVVVEVGAVVACAVVDKGYRHPLVLNVVAAAGEFIDVG